MFTRYLMKLFTFNLKLIYILILFSSITTNVFSKEISIFDNTGKPCAYLDTSDELTIYFWTGEPVAYLENDSIYGFNGKHLGWFEDGIIRDHKGYAVGFIEGALSIFTFPEPFKGFKKFKPFKSFKEFAPFKPFYMNQWSSNTLILILSKGMK